MRLLRANNLARVLFAISSTVAPVYSATLYGRSVWVQVPGSPGAATRACPYVLPVPNLPPPAGVLGSPRPRVRFRVPPCAPPGRHLLSAFVYLQSWHSSFIRSILPIERGSAPVRSDPRVARLPSRSYAGGTGPGRVRVSENKPSRRFGE
jgi:hypothetical protein